VKHWLRMIAVGAEASLISRNMTSNFVPDGIVGALNSKFNVASPVAVVVRVMGAVCPDGTNVTKEGAGVSADDHGARPSARSQIPLLAATRPISGAR